VRMAQAEAKKTTTEKTKKKIQPNPEFIEKATTLPLPDKKTLFYSEVAVQKNLLLLGKSGVGKTTCFEVLKDPGYCTPKGSSLFAGSRDAQYVPLIVRNLNGKAYSLNVIDTPGLFEVRSSNEGPKRSNAEILSVIQNRIVETVTTLSAVFIMTPLTSVLNQEDLKTLTEIQEFLGEHAKKITFLVFTKADTVQLETLGSRLDEFLKSELSLQFLEFCQGGIYFTGALSGESVEEYGDVYVSKVKRKVITLRQCLISALVSTVDLPLQSLAFCGNTSIDNVPNLSDKRKNDTIKKTEKKPKK